MPITIESAEMLQEYLEPTFSLKQCKTLFDLLRECSIALVRDIKDTEFSPSKDSVMLVQIKLGQDGVGFNMDIDQLSYGESMSVNQICDVVKDACLEKAKLCFPTNNEGDDIDGEEVPSGPNAI